jgi:hypothetical protein
VPGVPGVFRGCVEGFPIVFSRVWVACVCARGWYRHPGGGGAVWVCRGVPGNSGAPGVRVRWVGADKEGGCGAGWRVGVI